MAGKTAILAVRIISSANGKGFKKAARDVELFNSKMKRFSGGMKNAAAPLASLGRAAGRVMGTVAKFGTIASGATVAVAGLAVPIASMASAAGAALVPIAALTAAMAPAALASVGMAVGAVVVAFKGMGDAMAASNPDELAEAIKDMGPAAQAGATALNGLASGFRDLGGEIQESFWANVSNIGDLSVLIAPIGEAMNGVAADMGNAAAGLVDFVSHGTGLSAMEQLISSSGMAASNLGNAFADVLKGIIAVGAAAAPIFAELTEGMASAASGWAESMTTAFEDGSLEEYFRNAVEVAKEFGSVMSDIGSIIGGVWSAMSAAGQPMLSVIRDAISATEQWVNSSEGMSMMTNWFEQMGAAVAAVMPIIGQLAQIIIGTLSPAFAGVVQTLAPAVSMIADVLGQVLAAVVPILGPLAQIVALVGTALAGAVQAVMPIITQLADILTTGLSAAFEALQPVVPVIVDGFAQLAAGVQPLMPAFESLVQAVVGLIPPLVQAVSSIFPALISVMTAIVPVVAAVVSGLASFLGSVSPLISIVGSLVGGVLTALAAILRVVAAVISPVIQLAVSLGAGFGTVIGIAGRLVSIFGKVGSAIGTAIGWFSKISNAVSSLIGLIGNLIGKLASISFPSPPGWVSKLFGEDPAVAFAVPRGEPSSYGQFATGDFGFLRAAAATTTPSVSAPVTVNVNVRGAVVADDVQLAETITRALRSHGRVSGTTTAVGR